MQGAAIDDDQTLRRRTPVYSASLERALRASDGILELLPVATSICDLERRIVQYNRRAVEIWGRVPQAGETYEQFTAASRFYDAEGRPLPRSKLDDVLATGRVVRDEEMIVDRPNGQIVVVMNIDPLFDEHGRIVGAITCIQDITERKRALSALERSRQHLREQEERWAATYEHAAIGIVELDAEGRFLRVNQAICNIIGRSREELLGWRLFASTHPDDRGQDEALYRRQVSGELSFYSIEKRFIRGDDGRIVWVAIRSSTVRGDDGRFLYSVRVVQDITERREAEERQKLLIDELNHRVKNTLATVQSLATQTARGTSSPEEFRQAFEGRLIALSQAHDQLTRRHWKSADLRDIVTAATSAYLVRLREQIAIEGEPVTVTPRAGLTLALAFHELTTNAVKHGALSWPSGRIGVRWEVLRSAGQHPMLRIEWREEGGPPVVAPLRRGFGSRFIEGSVAAELQGVARLSFDPEGLRCVMDIPIETGRAKD